MLLASVIWAVKVVDAAKNLVCNTILVNGQPFSQVVNFACKYVGGTLSGNSFFK